MTTYALHLLGPPRLEVDGAIVRVGRRKAMALLAYLAATGRAHTRDALATLLWPEADASSARGELRRRLSLINQLLGGAAIEGDRETLQLSPDLDLWLDVAAFRAKLGACAAHGHAPTEACPDCVGLLEGAAALYTDTFMAGFTLEDSAAFDEWQFFEAEALKDDVASALVRLATYTTSQGDFDRAIGYARRWLAVDPLHEPAHRHLMVLYARSNQRAAALRQYETCRRLLEAELGVAPSARTEQAYQQILKGEALLAPVAVEAVLERELRVVGACPYRGLAAFSEADAPFFFGREAFVERLVQAAHVQPLVAMIVGPSGSGKSSVLRAGLLPRLRAEGGWFITDLRPTAEPFHALAAALCPMVRPELSGTDRLIETRKLARALDSGELPLHDVMMDGLDRSPGGLHLLLVVDQFEELYTLCPDPGLRRRFIDMLLSVGQAAQWAGRATVRLTLLLTLRADFMGQALSYRPLADALQAGSRLLGPMTREELRAAIEKPAEKQGAAFEAGLVERLLDDVGDEPGNLPLLEFALTLLWERLDFGWVTHAAYEAIGRVEGALARYADEVYDALVPDEQALARRVSTQLVQPGEGTEDTRRVATRADVGDSAWNLVQHLADQRLVVTGRDAVGGMETVEVVHEALIGSWGRLQAWMAEDRTFRTWHERLRVGVRTWENTGRDEGALLRGVPLAEAEEWLRMRGEDLGDTEYTFVEAGIALRQRRAAEREAQRFAELEAARRLAEAHDVALRQAAIGLAAEARYQMQGPGQDLAVLLALEAVKHFPYTWQAELALAEIVRDFRLVMSFPHGSPVAAALSPDGTRVATLAQSGVLTVRDLHTRATRFAVQAHPPMDNNYASVYWSPDGGRVLTVGWPAFPRIWDAETGNLLTELNCPGAYYAEWAPDGNRVITYYCFTADVATVWNAQTGREVFSIPGHVGILKWAHYSPGGDRILTSLGEIRDADSGGLLCSLPGYTAALTRDLQLIPSWSRDGTAVGAAANGTARVWNGETGREILVLPTGYRRGKLWWSPDGSRIIAMPVSGEVASPSLWNATTGEELLRFAHTSDMQFGVNPWSPAGECALFSDRRGWVTAWDAATGREVLRAHLASGGAFAHWMHDGGSILTHSVDGLVAVWRIATATLSDGCWPGCPVATRDGFTRPPVWSPTGDEVARVFADGSIRVWRRSRPNEAPRILSTGGRAADAIPFCYPGYMDWSADGTRVAMTYLDGGVEILNSSTGEATHIIPGHVGEAVGVAWSPDDRRLLTCGRDGRAVVWCVLAGDALVEIAGQDFYWGAWSPDGTRIVLTDHHSHHGPVRIWDSFTGEALLTLLPDDFPYVSVGAAWSPDGTRIVTVSLDRRGRVWDAETGELQGVFDTEIYPVDVEWSPCGERVLVSGRGPGVRVWDASTLQPVVVYPSEGERTCASWSPDGTEIAIAYWNGDLKVFPAWQSLEELVAYAEEHCVLRDLRPEERTQFVLPER